MDPAWPAALRDACLAAGVSYFFRQWGGPTPKSGGRELDSGTWDQIPERLTPAVAPAGAPLGDADPVVVPQ